MLISDNEYFLNISISHGAWDILIQKTKNLFFIYLKFRFN